MVIDQDEETADQRPARDGEGRKMTLRYDRARVPNSNGVAAHLGYAIGKTMQTQTISVNAGESILFHNYDTIPHTASFLRDATANNAPWPTSFNGGMTASPSSTVLGTTVRHRIEQRRQDNPALGAKPVRTKRSTFMVAR